MGEVRVSVRRAAMLERDWTKGNIFHNLLSLSWPMIIAGSLNIMGPIIPMIWVGKLGAASVAGLGVANSMAAMFTVGGMMGLTIGTRAIIARFVGSGDPQRANHVARQAFVISAAYSVVVMAIGIPFAETILSLFGLEANVVAEGAAYLRIICMGSMIICLRYMAEGIMQASGDTVTPMKIAIVYRLFHTILCPFLIFGWWLFPRLGIGGAAITDAASHVLGLVLALWVLLSGRTRLRLSLGNFRLDLHVIWRIVRIGVPAAIMRIQKNIGNLVLTWFMVPFGTLAVAAHSLVQRIEMILSLPCVGLGQASGVLVGQNLGAGRPERAEKTGWLALSSVEVFMLICSAAILLWAESIVRIFTPEPSLVAITSIFLRIATASYLFIGFEAIFQQCISGAGDTLPSMAVSLVALWLVLLPLSFLLPRVTDLGVYGVRLGMVIGIVVGAAAYGAYFRLGRWKRKRL
ncbi:MATE family efflux transporter [Chloroflexota bacterium]